MTREHFIRYLTERLAADDPRLITSALFQLLALNANLAIQDANIKDERLLLLVNAFEEYDTLRKP